MLVACFPHYYNESSPKLIKQILGLIGRDGGPTRVGHLLIRARQLPRFFADLCLFKLFYGAAGHHLSLTLTDDRGDVHNGYGQAGLLPSHGGRTGAKKSSVRCPGASVTASVGPTASRACSVRKGARVRRT